jgi:hypothetical protein
VKVLTCEFWDVSRMRSVAAKSYWISYHTYHLLEGGSDRGMEGGMEGGKLEAVIEAWKEGWREGSCRPLDSSQYGLERHMSVSQDLPLD